MEFLLKLYNLRRNVMKRRTRIEELPKDANVTKEEMKKIMGGYNIPAPRRGTLVGNPGSSSGANKFLDVYMIIADDHAFIRR